MKTSAQYPRMLSAITYTLISVVGLVAFLYPFWLPSVQTNATGGGHTQDAPAITALLIGMCLVAMLLDAQANTLNTKTIALLGVLVAINSVLRYIEVAIPGPGGFTPVFFLIMLCGVAFGARFGFLHGTLSLLVSAIITGGVGPWLPYQMFTAGWMGLTAGLLGRVLGTKALVPLILFAFVWGFAYGAIINLWFYPFAQGDPNQSWQPGISVWETVKRYAAFYATTSLVWDAFGAFGNAGLVGLFGAPTLRTLLRFKSKFQFVAISHTLTANG